MSLLQHKTIDNDAEALDTFFAAPAPRDPIQQFADAGVPVRLLMQHGMGWLNCLAEWERTDFPIYRLVGTGAHDAVLTRVTAVELLLQSAGWNWDATDSGAGPFDAVTLWEKEEGANAGVYFCDEACSDDNSVPLIFPDEIRESKRRCRQLRRAYLQRRRRAAAKKRAADEEELLAGLKLIIGWHVAKRAKDGVTLSWEEAFAELRAKHLDEKGGMVDGEIKRSAARGVHMSREQAADHVLSLVARVALAVEASDAKKQTAEISA